MADHLQQQILDEVKSILIAANTAAGSNVFLERVDELMESEFPAINVEGGDEDVTDESYGFPAIQRREYRFSTSCAVSGDNYGRDARNLQAQVEKALFAAVQPLNGKAQLLSLAGSDIPDKDGSGSTIFSAVRQHWLATYHTRAGTPDAPV